MTDRWEDGFSRGYELGWKRAAQFSGSKEWSPDRELGLIRAGQERSKPKRKLSDWQKYVKVNSKKPRFKYKSGSKRGRVNFKALGIAFRKTPAGKKKRG